MSARRRDSGEENDAVPFFGTWRKAYVAVVLLFVFDVATFYVFGRFFP